MERKVGRGDGLIKLVVRVRDVQLKRCKRCRDATPKHLHFREREDSLLPHHHTFPSPSRFTVSFFRLGSPGGRAWL